MAHTEMKQAIWGPHCVQNLSQTLHQTTLQHIFDFLRFGEANLQTPKCYTKNNNHRWMAHTEMKQAIWCPNCVPNVTQTMHHTTLQTIFDFLRFGDANLAPKFKNIDN